MSTVSMSEAIAMPSPTVIFFLLPTCVRAYAYRIVLLFCTPLVYCNLIKNQHLAHFMCLSMYVRTVSHSTPYLRAIEFMLLWCATMLFILSLYGVSFHRVGSSPFWRLRTTPSVRCRASPSFVLWLINVRSICANMANFSCMYIFQLVYFPDANQLIFAGAVSALKKYTTAQISLSAESLYS